MAAPITPHELRASLPPKTQLTVGDMDTRARAVLHLLLDHHPTPRQPITPNPNNCPNCDTPVANPKSPYCSECCRETSALIRQLRNGFLTGSLLDPEKQIPLGQKLWRLLGGGLPLRVAMIPAKAMARTIEKRGSICEVCGQPAVTVDNIGGG